MQALDLPDTIGSEIQWLHIPSHIGIKGNERADSLADQGRRKSLRLQGHVSIKPSALEPDVEDDCLLFAEVLEGNRWKMTYPHHRV